MYEAGGPGRDRCWKLRGLDLLILVDWKTWKLTMYWLKDNRRLILGSGRAVEDPSELDNLLSRALEDHIHTSGLLNHRTFYCPMQSL
jgi:hypothetical protein